MGCSSGELSKNQATDQSELELLRQAVSSVVRAISKDINEIALGKAITLEKSDRRHVRGCA